MQSPAIRLTTFDYCCSKLESHEGLTLLRLSVDRGGAQLSHRVRTESYAASTVARFVGLYSVLLRFHHRRWRDRWSGSGESIE